MSKENRGADDFKKLARLRLSPNDNEQMMFVSILQPLQDPLIIIDMRGTITTWNGAAELVYGHTAREVIGNSLESISLPAELQSLLPKIQEILNGKMVAIYESLQSADTSLALYHEVTLSPVFSRTGKMNGVSLITRDLTQLRKSEAALASSEAHLRAILEAATDFAIIAINIDGKITDWNSGAQMMFGYDSAEVMGKHAEIIFTPEDRKNEMAQVEIEVARTTGRSVEERWHLHKDGTRFFMSGVMTRIENPLPSGYVKVARILRSASLAEEALFLSEQRKSLAVQSAEIGEWEWDIETDHLKVSPLVYEIFGVAPDDKPLTSQLLLDRVYPPDEAAVKEQIRLAIDRLYVFQAEYRITRADTGEVRWANSYGRVVAHTKDRSSKMIGVIYDITARKVLENQREDFIGMASHELKTPVTAIKLYAELLEPGLLQTESQRDLSILKKLNVQVDRLTDLIQSLLDSGNVFQGNIELNPEPISLESIIEEYVRELRATIRSHDIDYEISPVRIVHADRERILQVIANVVGNAIKYSSHRTDIVVRLKDIGEAAMVSIQDNGMGVPLASQPYIFDRYYRVEREKGYYPDGFGLGLYISSEIIKKHHGSMWVESDQGKGSTFYFTLPYDDNSF